jgi:hypothetical protein
MKVALQGGWIVTPEVKRNLNWSIPVLHPCFSLRCVSLFVAQWVTSSEAQGYWIAEGIPFFGSLPGVKVSGK